MSMKPPSPASLTSPPPSGSLPRLNLAFLGRVNAGKSALVNALSQQTVSVVSPKAGTTTDPVRKTIELFPLGPCVLIDTPGLADTEATLGALREQQTQRILNQTDLALVVVSVRAGWTSVEADLWQTLADKQIPAYVVITQIDSRVEPSTLDSLERTLQALNPQPLQLCFTDSLTGSGLDQLKTALGAFKRPPASQPLISDLVSPGQMVWLVCPQDDAAPSGRLILPQVQTIRALIDCAAYPVITAQAQLQALYERIGQWPDLVITDSQVFGEVAASLPSTCPLTSFSILMARYKGYLDTALEGLEVLSNLQPGDRLLIAEGCTHHRQCDDIGTVKLPRGLKEKLQIDLQFDTCSGHGYPEDLSPYRLILHCGACMLKEREMQNRLEQAKQQGIPVVNYGLTLAWLKGILPRALAPLNRS